MDGVINVYKEEGISSFGVVSRVKKICNTGKVGHTGTLDPLATGVLPVCIGRATKIIQYIMENKKVYVAKVTLGKVTETYDKEGAILREKDTSNISNERIIEVINSFIGESLQIPPMYSALKVNGKRLYEMARQGIEIERQGRKVIIYNIDIIDISNPEVTIRVECSKGTYIRSLCYDIGEALGCGAYMSFLEREATGVFLKENSVRLEELSSDNVKEYIIPIKEVLKEYEELKVNNKFENLLLNGVNINDRALFNDNIDYNRIYRVCNLDGELLGLGEKKETGFKLIKRI